MLELVIGSLLLLMAVVICWSLCLWHLTLILRWLYIFGICMLTWYEMLVLDECPFNFDYLFFLSSFCYLWVSFSYQDSFPRIILWFYYMCVDRTLSLLHSESGSLIRWPRSQEVVYSYHLGSPQIDRRWMLLDTVVPLSFFLLSWRLLFIWCIYVSCVLRSYMILYCILIFLYLFSHTLWHVQWMLFIRYAFILLVVLIHLLIWLCMCLFILWLWTM